MRPLTLFFVVALLGAGCSNEGATTSTTAAPIATAAPTTTVAPTEQEAAPTLTFTGSECIYSGPDTFSRGELGEFTYSNESSVEVVMVVFPVFGVTLEDFVGDIPPTESWPPRVAEGPASASEINTRLLDPDTELTHLVGFNLVGDNGMACWPIDGSPAVPGGLVTVR